MNEDHERGSVEIIERLAAYRDDRGNVIDYAGAIEQDISIRLGGANNVLRVHPRARLKGLKVFFDCDNALIDIGPSRKGIPALGVTIRAGQDATVKIGRDVSSTARVFLSATEGTSVVIGEDVMFATGNEIRADDAHPIFDVRSGRRVNVSRSVHIGNHVWLARDAVVLGGVSIGDGTVVGYRSLVTRSLPNNCVAAGTPARVIRRDVAWERPHLDQAPPYKPTAESVKKSAYWSLTVPTDQAPTATAGAATVRGALRRLRGRLPRST